MFHIHKKTNYVVRLKNGWGYKKARANRLSKRTSTQQKAFNLARKNAKRNHAPVFIQGLNNKFRQVDNYRNPHY